MLEHAEGRPPGRRRIRLRFVAGGLLAALALAGYLVIGVVEYDASGERPAAGVSTPAPLVDPDDIVSGGPPPDGIPPIDRPRFELVSEVGWLTPNEPVLALEIRKDARAYPLQIMTWHEIVNDEVGGVPVSVTFCPLCNTPYAFVRPKVDGRVTTFGTSGKLYNSNLVMYDRATESLWPQAMGRAVVGRLTGTELERVPAQIVSWEEFRSAFPDGRVLSRRTGFQRPYGENPYPGYDDINNPPFLFEGEVDGRLAAKTRIVGIERDEAAFAIKHDELAERGVIAIDEAKVTVWHKPGAASALEGDRVADGRDVGATGVFLPDVDGRQLRFSREGDAFHDAETSSTWDIFGRAVAGPMKGKQLRPVAHVDTFWFAWAAYRPETTVLP